VLFVCLGNICRSVAAEMIFNAAVQEAGLADHVECDSCGTAAYHIGEKPDSRMLAALERAGFAYNGHRGRQFSRRDFENFDLKEIAALLELPLGTVKFRLYRARRELARMLAQTFSGKVSSYNT
jgi:protein-tyrosine-phosphatase